MSFIGELSIPKPLVRIGFTCAASLMAVLPLSGVISADSTTNSPSEAIAHAAYKAQFPECVISNPDQELRSVLKGTSITAIPFKFLDPEAAITISNFLGNRSNALALRAGGVLDSTDDSIKRYQRLGNIYLALSAKEVELSEGEDNKAETTLALRYLSDCDYTRSISISDVFGDGIEDN